SVFILQAEDGIRDRTVTGVQTCALPISLPHGSDPEYAERAIPQYERAIELSGGEPVRIPLDHTPAAVMKLIERCDAVLLPGSKRSEERRVGKEWRSGGGEDQCREGGRSE